MSNTKKYCDGLDCAICNEKEPCIYKIANELEEQLSYKEEVYIRNLNILANETEFLRKKLLMTEQECEKAKNIIKEALSDFWGEIGTKEYIKLTKEAKELGIEVKDYE